MIGVSLTLPAIAGRNRGAAPPFDPISINPIALYDPARSGALYQDEAQTVPVTGTAAPVGFMSDLGIHNNHVQQSDPDRRPTYHNAGGLHWIEGDGVDDMLIQPSIALTSSLSICIGAEITQVSGTTDALFSVDSEDGDFQFDAGVSGNFEARLNSTGLGLGTVKSNTAHPGAKVFTLLFDATSETATLRINGVQDWQQAGYNGALSSPQALNLFANRSTGSRIGAKVFTMTIWGDTNNARVQNIEQWTADRAGISI